MLAVKSRTDADGAAAKLGIINTLHATTITGTLLLPHLETWRLRSFILA